MKPLHDIFSTEEKEQDNKITTEIIVDTREKQSLVYSYLKKENPNTKFEKLDIGDFLIQDTIIERKTFSDFQSSIINKRLINQLKEMKKYPKQILLLEGFYYNYRDARIHENALRGFMISVIQDFQIPLVYTEDEKDTSKFLSSLAKRYNKQKQDQTLRPMKTAKTQKEQKRFILEGFPGIGATISKKLLEKFPNLKAIFNSKKEQLQEIDSFTEDKIDKFLDILNN
jgi:ERCC4-type nuclease